MPRISGRPLDWAIVVSGGLMLIGLALVSRAGNSGQLENTLVSPWHIPLYAGVVLAAVVLLASRHGSGGLSRGLGLLPPAYQLSAVGLVLFGLGFVGDVVWQGYAGDATGPDALITPTHLLAFLGIGLLLAGPPRSPTTTAEHGYLGQLPAVLALGMVLTLAGGMTQFANPLTGVPRSDDVVHRILDNQSELWSMDADGMNQTRLTSASDAPVGDPAWSRDGSRRASVTYAYRPGQDATRADSIASAIQLVSAEGTPLGTIRVGEAWLAGPIFSPDGDRLAINEFNDTGGQSSATGGAPLETPHPVANLPAAAVPEVAATSGRQWDVAIVKAQDGATPKVVARLPSTDIATAWSPDGHSLLVHSDRGGNFDVYRVDAATGSATMLTTDPATDEWATYSPDGTRIAFTSNRGGRYHLWLMDSDGANQKQLTSGDWDDWLPVWSPDGKALIFLSNRGTSADIFRIQADGTGTTNLSRTPTLDEWMTADAWYPDGQQILYTAGRSLPGTGSAVSLGIASVILWSILLSAFLLVGLRLQRLPAGAVTIVLTLSAALLASISEQYELIPAALVSGAVIDLLLSRPGLLTPTWREGLAASLLAGLFLAAELVALGIAGQNPWPAPIAISLVAVAALTGLATALVSSVHRHVSPAASHRA